MQEIAAHMVAHLESSIAGALAQLDDHARHLMPQTERRLQTKRAAHDMRVRAADRAIRNLDLHFLRPDRLYRKVDNADLAPLRLVRILHITDLNTAYHFHCV